MGRFSSLISQRGLDVVVALSALQAVLAIGLSGDSPAAPAAPLWFSLPAVVCITVPLVARRRYRFAAPALVWVLAAATSFVDARVVTFPVGIYLAGMVAAVLLGNLESGTSARRGLLVVLACACLVALNDPGRDLGEVLFTPLLFGVLWVTGHAIRQRILEAEAGQRRALHAEHEREEGERRAIAQERTRIAREMHDVVGHSLSVMTVQAAGVRRLLAPDQGREREALLAIEETGREALTEMRRLVAVLRDPSDEVALTPPAGLGQLPRLVEHARSSGLPVDLRVEGTPPRLSAGVDLAAYRVVQEGLTNAIRHAHARRAEVCVRYGGEQIEIEVLDDGRGPGPNERRTGGQGLAGMRERVSAYDGRLDAGPRPGGGYRVHALLPVQP